jgi:hypothetical protein
MLIQSVERARDVEKLVLTAFTLETGKLEKGPLELLQSECPNTTLAK